MGFLALILCLLVFTGLLYVSAEYANRERMYFPRRAYRLVRANYIGCLVVLVIVVAIILIGR